MSVLLYFLMADLFGDGHDVTVLSMPLDVTRPSRTLRDGSRAVVWSRVMMVVSAIYACSLSAAAISRTAELGQDPRDLTFVRGDLGRVLQRAGGVLEPEVEQFLLVTGETVEQFGVAEFVRC
jgi:hypothetical protein